MANNTMFSDKALYDASIKDAYKIVKHINNNDKTTVFGNKIYDIIDIQHDTQTGFDTMAVKDKSGNVMIVYGGTDFNNGNQDGLTDAGIAGTYIGNGTPEQFKQAKEFRDKVAGMNPRSDITLTGHSLGGGLSIAVVLQTKDHVVNLSYDFKRRNNLLRSDQSILNRLGSHLQNILIINYKKTKTFRLDFL